MSERNQQANARREYLVTEKDLPLSCPTDDMVLWNSHPRVFLPLAKEHRVKCPYCSAIYVLKKED